MGYPDNTRICGYDCGYGLTSPVPRTRMSLTATAIAQAKPTEKPRKLSDGGGLHLLVHPNGSKLWRFEKLAEGWVRPG